MKPASAKIKTLGVLQVSTALQKIKLQGVLVTPLGEKILFNRRWRARDIGSYTKPLYQCNLM